MKLFDIFKGHESELCIGAGLSFGAWAILLGIKATPKACELVKEKQEELGVDKLSNKDLIKTVGKCYIPTGIAAVASGSLIIAGSISAGNRAAAFAGAASLAENAYKEYKQATIETVGTEKEREVTQKAHEIHEERAVQQNKAQTVIVMSDDKLIQFIDPFDVLFKASIEDVRRACDEASLRVKSDGFSSWSDFRSDVGYSNYGFSSSAMYDDIGFTSAFKFDPDFDTYADKLPDGRPALRLRMRLNHVNGHKIDDYYYS